MTNTTNAADDLETLTLTEALTVYGLMSERPGLHSAEDWDVIGAELERLAQEAASWARQSITDRARDARLNAMSARARAA